MKNKKLLHQAGVDFDLAIQRIASSSLTYTRLHVKHWSEYWKRFMVK